MSETVALTILGFILGPPLLMIGIILLSECYNMYCSEYVENFYKNIKNYFKK